MSSEAANARAHDQSATPQVVVADPCAAAHPRLVAAAARAGAYGLLDASDATQHAQAVADLRRRRVEEYWLRPGTGLAPVSAPGGDAPRVSTVVLAGQRVAEIDAWRAVAPTIVAQVTSVEAAREAVAAGADGLLVSGREAGGAVGPTEASILLQQTVTLGVPVWVRGGIGPHTAAAAVAGGAAGGGGDIPTGLMRESAGS